MRYKEDYKDYICGCCGDHTPNVTWNEDLERDECNNCLVDNLKGKQKDENGQTILCNRK